MRHRLFLLGALLLFGGVLATLPVAAPAQAAAHPGTTLPSAPVRARAAAAVPPRVTTPKHGLRVVVAKPPGQVAHKVRVTVTGPHGFHHVLKKTTTFAHAAPGRYRIKAAKAKARTGTAYPSPSRRKVKVSKKRAASVTVSYRTVVAAKTKVVPTSAVHRVSGPVDGSRTVVVAGRAKYAVGDFLVSGSSAAAPDGLLTRVTKRAARGGSTTYTVVPATLPQVVPEGAIAQTVRTPTESVADNGTLSARRGTRTGVTARSSVSSGSGCVANAQVALTRTLSAGISLEITGSWDKLHPSGSYLRATASASASASLEAVATAEASCTTGKHQLGKTINLPKITFTIGPVPVVIVPTLKFYGSASAQVGGAITASAGLFTSANAWVQGTLGGKVSTGVTPPNPMLTHQISAGDGVTGTASATLSAQFSADLYGLAGPYVTLNAGPKISLAPTKKPWVSIDADFSLDVGLTLDKCVEAWGASLCADFDIHKDGLIKKTWPIWHSNTAPSTTNTGGTGGTPTPPPGGGGSSPAPGTGTTNWTSISASADHTCGVRGDGTAWCWGYNGSGQLGDGSTIDSTVPAQVGTATDWTTISAGAYTTTCAVRGDGTAWCWGDNDFSALGDGSTTGSSVPVRVGTATNWTTISTDGYHTCGVRSDGTAWCWGMNEYGELGDGTIIDSGVPVRVGTATDWTSISVGYYDACGVRGDGTAWCWGNNYYGQLGDGTTIDSDVPAQVGTATDWTGVSVGPVYGDACGVRGDGTAWCWGDNGGGQLGDGTTTDSSVPVRVGTATDWTSISVGDYDACGVRGDGTAWCWGSNVGGQLGDSTTTDSSVPVQVGTATDWTSISTDVDDACGVRGDGTAWCWGSNGYGQLGDGTTTNSSVPVEVVEPD